MKNFIFHLVLCAFCLPAVTGCAPSIQAAVLATQVDSAGRALNSAMVFSVDTPRIICSVSTAGLPSSTTVQALWLYNDGTVWNTLKEESFTVGGAGYIVFAVNAPDPGWRQGNYAVRLLLDGRQSAEKQFSIKINEGASLPLVNNFSATPDTITPGQALTLSWNVSGASRVSISPDIGSVDAGGSRAVTPKTGTTYTITALSSGGPSSKSVSVQVLPPVIDTGDLAVVDVFREASMVYYTVRNGGSAVSKPSSAKLYVGMNVMGSGYIPPIAPGELKTLVFGTFAWSYAYPTPATVCVDTQNENGPSNGEYKCLTRVLAGMQVL